MGGSSSKQPAQATQEDLNELQARAQAKGGQPLTLKQGKTFEIEPNRGCTDIFFLLVYIAAWVGMILIAGFGFSKGEPERLHYGYDFNGNTCGIKAMSKRPYVYYPFPFPTSDGSSDFTWAVCMDKCPSPDANAIPNGCIQKFQVSVGKANLIQDVKADADKTYMCGGLDGGQTDFSQFGANPLNWFAGYNEYCLKRRPLCKCKKGPAASSCCEPDAGSGEVGSQEGTSSEVLNATALQQFGVPIGYRYGFCFVSYPTYIPGLDQGSVGTNKWTRCIPSSRADASKKKGVNGTTSFTQGIALIANSGVSGVQKTTEDNKLASLDTALSAVAKSMAGPRESLMSLVEQLRKYKWVILGCCGIALLVSLLYTFMLKVAALPLILSILVLVWGLLAILTAILGFKAGYIDPAQIPGTGWAQTQLPEGTTFGPAETNLSLVIASCVLSSIFLFGYTCALCVMIPRVVLACKIINTASVCLASIPTTLVFPVIQFFFTIILTGYFVVVCWYLASAGTWDPNLHQYVWDSNLQGVMLLHFFGYLWGIQFILAFGNLAIAGAAAEWFLADDKAALQAPAIAGAKRALRYHCGTVAFGSFIIAVVQLIRWIFRFYMYQLKKLDKDGTFKHVIAVLSCIGECCLSCLERFLNFINKNAYIQTAITGNSFCKAASDAAMLLIRNCLRVGTLQLIATVFIFLGKYFIALFTAVIGAVWMVALDGGGNLTEGWANVSAAPVFPVLVVLIFAFSIACAFMDVWDMVIDTIFQCYCMDEEYGSGKTPGEMRKLTAENPPSAGDLKAITAVTTGNPKA